ncbi:unnamed protein product [Cylicocyclus nassatus]|uniref:DUF1758 domain-containing protein n=1 Tax=Cylicocyclus nassatus TaxID=53992 RepID=A0AA36DUZ7_CYLNA|nr:unnamed protein product [Cylicocyclus nassatus]
MSDSASIRRQIGFFKKQLQKYCSDANVSLREYDISPTAPQLEALSDDAIETFRLEITAIRSNLLKAYAKITKLDEEWNALQQASPEEQQVLAEYLKKYGDYHVTVADAVKWLETLDVLLNFIDQDFTRRHLTLSSISSETHTPDEDQPWNRGTNLHVPAISQPTDVSLLNFVDASILSKLELPTFDGNLLDYPEFQSRFATLVGNKVQLDDTTKFSLLKSCLRGKALQVIQGLSMTPANYKVATDILRTHFDDKVTLKHILYTKLASLPPCDPEGRNLLPLYNQMFSLVRQFSNGNDESTEKALAALLLNKLPPRVKSQIYDQTQHDHNVLPLELLHLLTSTVRKESTLSEMELYSKSSFSNPLRYPHQGTYITKKQPRSHSPKSVKFRQGCPFCDSQLHSAVNCTRYATPQQRFQQAKKRRCAITVYLLVIAPKNALQNFIAGFVREDITHLYVHPRENHAVHFDNIIQTSCADEETKKTQATPTFDRNPQDITLTSSQRNSPAPLMCTEVRIFNPDNPSHSLTTTAFLDSGSTTTYITNDLAAVLDLPAIETETLNVATFGEPIEIESSTFRLGIETENGNRCFTVKSSPSLPNEVMQVTPGYEPSVTTCSPSLLIGNDYFWDLVLSHNFYYKSLPEGYRLLHTSIGDIILKRAIDMKMNECSFVSIDSDNDDAANPANHNDLCELVSRFWRLKSIGILDNPDQSDDEECLKHFNDTIYYDSTEKRYVVTLPFKTDPSTIPDNHALAFSRLCNQVRTLQENPTYLGKYHAVIEDQLQRNIIEEVSLKEIHQPCHYLSHHGVLKKDDKNLKIRCVYDGSAKMKGQMSLNEALHRGPVLLPDLVGILLRTRLCKILISSDIEKAFLMVGLNHKSRDYTRFLWLKDPHRPPTPANLVTYRFTRVPFGLCFVNACSAMLSLTPHFEAQSPRQLQDVRSLRQQISIAKQQLLRAIEETNRECIEISQLQTLNNDELLNTYEGHTSAHDSLLRTYSHIYHLWNEWQKLILVNQQENQVLEQYVATHGNFRQTLEDAVDTLQRLDHERPLLEGELKRKTSISNPTNPMPIRYLRKSHTPKDV